MKAETLVGIGTNKECDIFPWIPSYGESFVGVSNFKHDDVMSWKRFPRYWHLV